MALPAPLAILAYEEIRDFAKETLAREAIAIDRARQSPGYTALKYSSLERMPD